MEQINVHADEVGPLILIDMIYKSNFKWYLQARLMNDIYIHCTVTFNSWLFNDRCKILFTLAIDYSNTLMSAVLLHGLFVRLMYSETSLAIV